MTARPVWFALFYVAVLAAGCRGKTSSETILDSFVPKPKASYTAHMALMVSISDDGRLAAKVTSDGRLVLADISAKKAIWQRDVKGRCVQAVAVDPSGRYLAYPLDCGNVIVENVITGKQTIYRSPASERSIHSIAMAEGGYPLAFGACGRGVYLIRTSSSETQTLHSLDPCESEDDAVSSLAFSVDGRLLAAGWGYWHSQWKKGSEDRLTIGWEDAGEGPSVGVSIWSTMTGNLIAELPGTMSDSTAAFAASREMMVAYGGSPRGRLSIWDTRQGRRARDIQGPLLENPQFVQGGALLVGLMPHGPSSNPQIRVFATGTGEQVGGAESVSEDIMTRGHSAAGLSDKFLVAHRTGEVDVYRVSRDGRSIERVWSF